MSCFRRQPCTRFAVPACVPPQLGRLLVTPFATTGVLAAVLVWEVEHLGSVVLALAIAVAVRQHRQELFCCRRSGSTASDPMEALHRLRSHAETCVIIMEPAPDVAFRLPLVLQIVT